MKIGTYDNKVCCQRTSFCGALLPLMIELQHFIVYMVEYPMQSGASQSHFDPDIINEFLPENAINITEEDQDTMPAFMHRVSQVTDLKAALAFADKEIVPHFHRDNLANISHLQLIAWIKALHALAGKTVFSELLSPAGEYAKTTVFRWHKSTRFFFDLATALIRKKDLRPLFKEYYGNSAESRKLAQDFPEILAKYKNNPKVIVPEYELDKNDKHSEIRMMFLKLAYAQHLGLLTPKELGIVSKVCKICMPPEKVPQAMEDFATKLLKKLQLCDGSLDQVAEVAAWAFREFTDIHPFPNCNGRIATIFVNLILLAFGYPSIVLRTSLDKFDPNSEYNRVIQYIDTKPELLMAYIKQKVVAQLKKKPAPQSEGSWDAMIVLMQSLQSLMLANKNSDTPVDVQQVYLVGACKLIKKSEQSQQADLAEKELQLSKKVNKMPL